MLDFIKNKWVWLVSGVGALLALFFVERSKRQSAESDLQLANTKQEDALINQRKEQLDKDIKVKEAQKVSLNDEVKKEVAESDKNVEDFYKKRGV